MVLYASCDRTKGFTEYRGENNPDQKPDNPSGECEAEHDAQKQKDIHNTDDKLLKGKHDNIPNIGEEGLDGTHLILTNIQG